jgi:hypothetical protein
VLLRALDARGYAVRTEHLETGFAQSVSHPCNEGRFWAHNDEISAHIFRYTNRCPGITGIAGDDLSKLG